MHFVKFYLKACKIYIIHTFNFNLRSLLSALLIFKRVPFKVISKTVFDHRLVIFICNLKAYATAQSLGIGCIQFHHEGVKKWFKIKMHKHM